MLEHDNVTCMMKCKTTSSNLLVAFPPFTSLTPAHIRSLLLCDRRGNNKLVIFRHKKGQFLHMKATGQWLEHWLVPMCASV